MRRAGGNARGRQNGIVEQGMDMEGMMDGWSPVTSRAGAVFALILVFPKPVSRRKPRARGAGLLGLDTLQLHLERGTRCCAMS